MFLPFLDTFETGETRKIVKKWDKTEHRRRKSRCEEFTHYNCTLLTIYLGPPTRPKMSISILRSYLWHEASIKIKMEREASDQLPPAWQQCHAPVVQHHRSSMHQESTMHHHATPIHHACISALQWIQVNFAK